MSFESDCQHLAASLQLEPKSFAEFSQQVALEFDMDVLAFFDLQSALLAVKLELISERSVIRSQLELTLNGSFVLNSEVLASRTLHRDVSHVKVYL